MKFKESEFAGENTSTLTLTDKAGVDLVVRVYHDEECYPVIIEADTFGFKSKKQARKFAIELLKALG